MRHHTVRDVTTKDVVAVTRTTPFKEIVDILQQHRVSGVPVIDADRTVVGVVSEVDLVRKETRPDGRFFHRAAGRKAAATTAGGLLSTPPVTVGQDATLEEAARLLVAHHVRRLPVVDARGRLVGIVCPKDLLRVFLRSDEDIERDIARDVFERGLWTAVTPATVRIDVRHGVATLAGEVQWRSLVPAAVAMTRRVDGVVGVVNDLTYAVDDTRTPAMAGVDMAQEHWQTR